MAQQTRTALQNTIDTNLPDNSAREITAEDTRVTQTNLNDSAFNILTDDSDDITEGSSQLFMTVTEQNKLGFITVTGAVNLDTLKSTVDGLTNAVVLKGEWDASTGEFPGGGNAMTGWSYIVTTGGTVDGVEFTENDRIVAITDNASQSDYAGNWLKLDYTDAVLSVAGKTGAVTLDADDVSNTAGKVWLTTTTQTISGVKTFSSGIKGFRPINAESGSLALDGDNINMFNTFAITGAVTITVADETASAATAGDEIEVFWQSDSGSNSITFATSGSQTIISKGSFVELVGIGSAAVLKYLGSNTWALIGDLI
jgi:hypothetical protein